MILEIIRIYKEGDKQVYVDIKENGIVSRKKVDDVIDFISKNDDADCINFSVIANSYFRGKNCKLKMEVFNHEQARLGNSKQKGSSRGGLTGVKRGITRERETGGIRQDEVRGHSIGVTKTVTNQDIRVQDATRARILEDEFGITILPECNSEQFYNDFSIEHKKAEFAPFVDMHSIKELSEMNCYGHKDLGFYAVQKDGNISKMLIKLFHCFWKCYV